MEPTSFGGIAESGVSAGEDLRLDGESRSEVNGVVAPQLVVLSKVEVPG